MSDFLHDLIEAATRAAMESPGAAAQLERELRHAHGGEHRYIARTGPADRVENAPRFSTGATSTRAS